MNYICEVCGKESGVIVGEELLKGNDPRFVCVDCYLRENGVDPEEFGDRIHKLAEKLLARAEVGVDWARQKDETVVLTKMR